MTPTTQRTTKSSTQALPTIPSMPTTPNTSQDLVRFLPISERRGLKVPGTSLPGNSFRTGTSSDTSKLLRFRIGSLDGLVLIGASTTPPAYFGSPTPKSLILLGKRKRLSFVTASWLGAE